MQPVWHCLVHTYSADSINLTNSKCWFMPRTTVHAGCAFGRLICTSFKRKRSIWPLEKFVRAQLWVFATYFRSITFQRLFMLSANWPIAWNFTQDAALWVCLKIGDTKKHQRIGKMMTNCLILRVPMLEYTVWIWSIAPPNLNWILRLAVGSSASRLK